MITLDPYPHQITSLACLHAVRNLSIPTKADTRRRYQQRRALATGDTRHHGDTALHGCTVNDRDHIGHDLSPLPVHTHSTNSHLLKPQRTHERVQKNNAKYGVKLPTPRPNGETWRCLSHEVCLNSIRHLHYRPEQSEAGPSSRVLLALST